MIIRRLLVSLPLFAVAAGAQELPSPLRLADAMRIALENNPSYVQSLNDEAMAVAAREAQKRTLYLPRPRLTLSTRGGSSQSSTPLATSSSQNSNTSLSLSAGVTLLDNGLRGNTLTRMQETIETTEIDHVSRERTLRTQVTTAYRNAQRSQLQIALQERQLARSQHDVELKNKQLALAMQTTLTDVRSAELVVLNDQDALESARSDAILARLDLLEAMGIRGDRPIAIDTIIPEISDPSRLNIDSLIALAMPRSPEVQTAELRVRATEREAGFQRSSWWRPGVTGQLGFGRSQSSSKGFNAAFDPWPDNGSLSADATFSLTLPDYFQTRNQIQAANVAVSDQHTALRGTQIQIENNVRAAAINLQNAYRAYLLAQQRSQLNQDRLRTANLQFSQGSMQPFTLQQIIDAAALAERGVLAQRFAVLSAQLALDNIVGTPTER